MKLTALLACMFIPVAGIAFADPSLPQPEKAPSLSGPGVVDEQVDATSTTMQGPQSPDEPDLPDGGAPPVADEDRPRNPYEYHFRASAGATYDDNIFISHNNAQDDFVTGLSAGVTLGMGDLEKQKGSFLLFSYDVSPYFFAKHPKLDAVDQDGLLRAQWTGSKLTLTSVFQYIDYTGSDKDAGDRVNRKVYQGNLNALYAYSDKTRLGLEFRATLTDYAEQYDQKEVMSTGWGEYQVTPLIAAGGGATVGYLDVQGSGSQTYEQLNGRVNYALAAKVSIVASAGVEFRQASGNRVTPVFDLMANYSPYDLLKMTLDAYRRVIPSIISRNQDTDVTGVSFGVTERFLTVFEADVTGGFENTVYHSDKPTTALTPSENYAYVRGSLVYILSDRWRVETFGELRTNHSTESDRSFDEHRTGVTVSFNF